ncbi:hypothetical protein M3Y98_00703600 [Aphelenchoides besseyi]|nr:hypothetical protein M3Y98_00703600 [Aphelenchoides besseyi]
MSRKALPKLDVHTLFLAKLLSKSDVEWPTLTEESKKTKFYNDEKVIEEFERIKEIVNRVIEMTTTPQIDLCRKLTVEKADNRHQILQELEHLSRWRQFLENRFAQFLILRYEKIPTAHFLDPMAIGDPVERRETFRWFKFHLFVQHFRVHVDAWPLNAVNWSAVGEWGRWAQLHDLALNSIPEVDTKTVETVTKDAKTRMQTLCDFVDQIDLADEERREYVQLFKDMHICVLD